MGIWDVRAETDRVQWDYVPSVRVGPLRFGMNSEEAVAALDGFTGAVYSPSDRYDGNRTVEFRNAGDPSYRVAVTVYISESEGLFCVVPDAQFGPQVTIDGIKMVGQAPSIWETHLLDYLSSRGITPRYAPGGDPGADELGLIMSVQRAGDVVLTRPAFLIPRECAYTLWDALPDPEGKIR
jgi:hypothetical protein